MEFDPEDDLEGWIVLGSLRWAVVCVADERAFTILLFFCRG